MTNETTSSGRTGATASGAIENDTTSAESQPTVLFFSSSFCDPCATARNTLDQVSKLVSHVRYAELDVARHSDEAERAGIVSTPTIVIVAANGDEIFRAQGAPTVNQMLVALAKAV
ncbi:thiol-disulfide isomerase/thioredoxin [Rhodoglobus vestalii]|uniref:Thiol-disulfide isomerase/thioredoxin n=1 Tax=Rhodoglobus vestalii TaxID=193384 RepID=A0A8H2K884_9MICO|nr:thioredoxin family protein [Rhodoglobus vestalii]TQO20960.1 thiol-disulfide isomerase/thioredoxin [Rhodoglobus vestalii]